MAKNRIPTPLEYVHWKAGWPAPEEEPEVQMMPVPTPVYMPNPRTVDESQMFGMDQMGGMGGPSLPPPIAPPPPPGMSGNGGGFFAPDGGAFG
jgi:hypothetical protein